MTPLPSPYATRTAAASRPALDPSQIHLWVIGTEWAGEHPEHMVTSELDDRERERAAAFVRPVDRLTYLMAHIALRRLLTAYTGIRPAELPLGRDTCPCCGGPHGRPVLHGTGLHFSLSHSHGIALISIATAPLGVDVQRVPTQETVELCLPELHPAEQRELRALQDAEQPLAFGRLWTRKEAYLKGLGTGLGRELSHDYLGERTDPDAPVRPRGWRIENMPSCPAHVAAVALATPADSVAEPTDILARRLPTECLYTDDATERIAAERQVCPNWE